MMKIGVTMRSSDSPCYHEPRDGVARDWYSMLAQFKGQYQWILLPNLGKDTLDYALSHGVNALLLTGGDDLGAYVDRDTAEYELLAHAMKSRWPVLGVCRGMQILNAFFGGQQVASSAEHHCSIHRLEFSSPLPWAPLSPSLQVKSFHCQGIRSPAAVYMPLAWYSGICEAFEHKTLPWVGVMWHPERQQDQELENQWLFEYVFGV